MRGYLLTLFLCLVLPVTAGSQPLTLTNCDRPWHFTRPPVKVLVYTPPALENLLALDLGASVIAVVGDLPGRDTAPSPWQRAGQLPARYDAAPWSAEAILATRPDFIYSASYYWFNSPETPDRARLARWGIATWLSENACQGQQRKRQHPLHWEDLFDELRNIAAIYHVTPRAERLIRTLENKLAALRQSARCLPARRLMWWYSGLSVPYVAGNTGAPALLTRTVGSTNIFADEPRLWPEVSWEVVAARDPDVLILGDLRRGTPGDSAADKIAYLEHNPITATMRAVRQRRYIILPGYDLDPSARSLYALERLITQLHTLTTENF
ncbi:periplasmic binding protein [Shimwellia blattae DSM 4481 = NBRC 105725]|uniref:Periplasmic binding protein n=1 Tax=Shimwellia blattae (strain ATCC 29907 / DSM 4481 / JCM 1650 / NBRC 105725 / CDC 9005-74) TaxID=630626 RepID=I2B8H5_SHIBC|nr:periplasmic binding protein [Shimwellia blattae DSM 4481 = NBRC 105725]GAB82969.1 putative ABC transporter substrate-binding protein [Shimwellia blattae DSM 4481 = NBRC 105725]VDY64309.1 vitamin B12-transporter protein BtuF [Shimwellia blattae]VEC22433.1 vitamin B12-transporter protein BtuF [Shimwellia blattae]